MNFPRLSYSRRSLLGLLFSILYLSFIAASVVAQAPALTPAERENILLSRKADGTLASATSPEEWKSRRDSILNAAQSIMGPLPGAKRCPLDIKVEEEADCGTYVRRLITYSAEPGGRTPAYLCIPKAALEGKVPAPAVLCLHPTENKIGFKVVVGLGGKEHRQYASELAERG